MATKYCLQNAGVLGAPFLYSKVTQTPPLVWQPSSSDTTVCNQVLPPPVYTTKWGADPLAVYKICLGQIARFPQLFFWQPSPYYKGIQKGFAHKFCSQNSVATKLYSQNALAPKLCLRSGNHFSHHLSPSIPCSFFESGDRFNELQRLESYLHGSVFD